MGSATSKCSDVSHGNVKTNVKPLDASDSEEEEEEDDDEDEDDEGGDDERRNAEDVLNGGVQRGKEASFKEAIDHATSVGIDVDKILKAEAKLEEHKAVRRREAFESDIKDYLEEANQDVDACREKLANGKQHGVSEKLLAKLEERIEALDQNRELDSEEVEKARLLIERNTRKFVSAAVQGRPVTWIDLDSGEKTSATLFIDLVLHNAKVIDESGAELGFADLMKLRPKPSGAGDDVVVSKEGFQKLSDADKKLALCITHSSDPWCLVEPNLDGRDEVLCGLMVVTGSCIDEALRSTNGAAPKASSGAKEEAPPAAPEPAPPPPVVEEEPPEAAAGNEAEEEEFVEEEGSQVEGEEASN